MWSYGVAALPYIKIASEGKSIDDQNRVVSLHETDDLHRFAGYG
jgi:hypothetical protein